MRKHENTKKIYVSKDEAACQQMAVSVLNQLEFVLKLFKMSHLVL